MSLNDAKRWLERARKRLFAAIHTRNEVQREPGESWKHWRARNKTAVARVDHREEIKDRLAKKVAHLEKKKDDEPATSGVTTFDGKQVAAWIAVWLEKCRRAGWQGTVISGYRSPAYSISLCQNMCGQPSCSGTCAGASSNHSGSVYPAGAVDVDVAHATQFEAVAARIGCPLHNSIGASDPNHMSHSGY